MSAEPFDALAAPPVFIVGAHRSGTTWLFEALCAHPEVGGAYESGLFTETGFGGLLQGHLWREEFEERNRALTTHHVGVGQLVDRPTVVAAVRDLSARWLAEALGEHVRYLVEKTPMHYQAVGLIAEIFPSARFVHVLRDGRDVALSMRAAGRSWQPGWRLMTYGPPWIAARAWANAVSTARRELDRVPNPSLEVRYEELRTDPVRVLRRLFDFCEIPADPATLDEIAARTSFSSHSGTGETSFRRRGEEGEWRRAFGPLDRLVFRLAAADAMAETGYAPPPGRMMSLAQRSLGRARARRDELLGRR